jgi:hypothetical protein
MVDASHRTPIFNRYIKIICDIFPVDYVNAFELYGVKTPFDIQINGDCNIEVKIQKKLVLEQYTDDDKEIPGWVFTLCDDDVDYVLIFFPDKNTYVCLKAFELCYWWRYSYNQYQKIRNDVSCNGDANWVSSFSPVSINDIPEEIIYKTNMTLYKNNSTLKDYC